MAKSYIDIVKYMVEARFEIGGLVEKPDIIGAVFGQTEGLLGSDLDLRELQKNGKIGRIEIDTQTLGNRTAGRLHLPSSLGRVETCILAAAIESVDRVGPFETHFKVDKIEDTRNEKRRKIVDRAKELVKNLMNTGMPDSREISDMVEVEIKSSVVTEYGPEKLAAGPDIATSDDIILVEGRADVITLLKSDITNCIAIGGATGTIPKTIVDLIQQKETTMFLDGDRGGDIILKGIMNAGEIDFVARAPDGKEVEELQRKEIIKALRSRVPVEQIKKGGNGHSEDRGDRGRSGPYQRPPSPSPVQRQTMRQTASAVQQQQYSQPAQVHQQQAQILSPTAIINNMSGRQQPEIQSDRYDSPPVDSDLGIKDLSGRSAPMSSGPTSGIPSLQNPRASAPSAGNDQKLVTALNELHNTLRGRMYSADGAMMSEVPIRELIQAIQDTRNINAIVFDGIITQRLVDLANRLGIREIYGIRASQVTRTYDGMKLYTKEQGKM